MEGTSYNPEFGVDDPELELKKKSNPEMLRQNTSQRSPEHIGHVLVDVEAKDKKKSHEADVVNMDREELLKMAAMISVESGTLRQIYESHLIDESGLKRLVAEYLKGNDIEKVLHHEVVEREIDFERDPAMRGHHQGLADPAPADSGTTLDGLLKKANATIGSSNEEIAFLKAKASYTAQHQSSGGKSRAMLVDVVMISTIAVLATAVAILIISRG